MASLKNKLEAALLEAFEEGRAAGVAEFSSFEACFTSSRDTSDLGGARLTGGHLRIFVWDAPAMDREPNAIDSGDGLFRHAFVTLDDMVDDFIDLHRERHDGMLSGWDSGALEVVAALRAAADRLESSIRPEAA